MRARLRLAAAAGGGLVAVVVFLHVNKSSRAKVCDVVTRFARAWRIRQGGEPTQHNPEDPDAESSTVPPEARPICDVDALLSLQPNLANQRHRTFCCSSPTHALQSWHQPDPSSPKLLVCHDMANGYDEDRWVQGCPEPDAYRLWHWHCVDAFVYFSHHMVTLPPPGWVHAAHHNGVKVLGTFITEWGAGKAVCERLFRTRQSAQQVADRLVSLASHHGFEGWLINIENDLPRALVPNLLHFVAHLRARMQAVVPHGNAMVLWYDAITMAGKLTWQNSLVPAANGPFLDAAHALFVNYAWKSSTPGEVASVSGSRAADVYLGVDVWGRGTFGGGQDTCDVALRAARASGVSAALFAPGWVWEAFPRAGFVERQERFWGKVAAAWGAGNGERGGGSSGQLQAGGGRGDGTSGAAAGAGAAGPGAADPAPAVAAACGKAWHLPFHTNFCTGRGPRGTWVRGIHVSRQPWFNLSAQDTQPLLPPRVTETPAGPAAAAALLPHVVPPAAAVAAAEGSAATAAAGAAGSPTVPALAATPAAAVAAAPVAVLQLQVCHDFAYEGGSCLRVRVAAPACAAADAQLPSPSGSPPSPSESPPSPSGSPPMLPLPAHSSSPVLQFHRLYSLHAHMPAAGLVLQFAVARQQRQQQQQEEEEAAKEEGEEEHGSTQVAPACSPSAAGVALALQVASQGDDAGSGVVIVHSLAGASDNACNGSLGATSGSSISGGAYGSSSGTPWQLHRMHLVPGSSSNGGGGIPVGARITGVGLALLGGAVAGVEAAVAAEGKLEEACWLLGHLSLREAGPEAWEPAAAGMAGPPAASTAAERAAGAGATVALTPAAQPRCELLKWHPNASGAGGGSSSSGGGTADAAPAAAVPFTPAEGQLLVALGTSDAVAVSDGNETMERPTWRLTCDLAWDGHDHAGGGAAARGSGGEAGLGGCRSAWSGGAYSHHIWAHVSVPVTEAPGAGSTSAGSSSTDSGCSSSAGGVGSSTGCGSHSRPWVWVGRAYALRRYYVDLPCVPAGADVTLAVQPVSSLDGLPHSTPDDCTFMNTFAPGGRQGSHADV